MKKVADNIIVEGLKAGDERAYRYVYATHYALLCRFATQFLGSPPLAEEVVDDVIFNLWENRAGLDITVSLRAYLLASVRNRCLNELNSLDARRSADVLSLGLLEDKGLLDRIFADDAHPLGSLLEQELEDEVRDAVDNLPEPCRAVFLESRVKQKTYDEIARDMGISANTVKYHIKNALNLLRTRLSSYLKRLALVFIAGI